jgi:hypothetical protein
MTPEALADSIASMEGIMRRVLSAVVKGVLVAPVLWAWGVRWTRLGWVQGDEIIPEAVIVASIMVWALVLLCVLGVLAWVVLT